MKLSNLNAMRGPVPTIRNERGFTLTELLVAAGLSMFILASIGSLFRAQTHTIKGQESRMEAHEYALTVLDIIAREMRNTGYFPTAACDATGGITAASATSISFQYDKNNDGACSGDDEVITFSFAGSDVTRNPLTTNQVLTDGNATNLQFTYYPQQTSGTAPAPYCVSAGNPSGCSGTLSANLKNVQKIVISLTVAPKSTDSQFTGSAITMSQIGRASCRERV